LRRFAGFYLAGGTALALQIGHRVSIDFDLFTDQQIGRGHLQKVRQSFGEAVTIEPLVNNADELTVLVNGVKVTFLSYPFPPQEPLADYLHVPLLSVREIAATKAYTIGRRGSFKDYVDLYYVLVEKRATLPEVIADAEHKFGSDFNARLFLEQLVDTTNLDDTNIRFLKRPVTEDEVAQLFGDRIREMGALL
jgi:hypothetical protein